MDNSSLLIILLTGLTTGGLTCLALQGGLLASVIAQQPKKPATPAHPPASEKTGNPSPLLPIFSFLGAKLVSHTILGLLLGLIGSSLSLSPTTRGWFQIIIGIYLFGVAGNLLDLHPFFRYFIITPPRFFAKIAKSKSKSSSVFAPFLLGLLTVFIPCATTQAIAIIALGTGNPIHSAAIMFTFTLGTIPTFLIFGFLLQKGTVTFRKYFPTIASLALFVMSLYSVNSGIAVMGSPYTTQNFYQVATQKNPSSKENFSVLGKNIQTTTITVTNSGYAPKNITLKKGVLTRLKLITSNVQSCSHAFTIPSLKIEKILPETGETTVEFTPQKEGLLAFACSMGMYTGKFNIVN